MKTEAELVMENIVAAKVCEDIFGTLEGSVEQKLSLLAVVYKRLARKVHPDVNGSSASATQAFTVLNQHHDDAKEKIKHGSYGSRTIYARSRSDSEDTTKEMVIASKYMRYASFGVGDIADLHACYVLGTSKRTELLLKVARQPRDQILMEVERNNLLYLEEQLSKHPNGKEWRQCIPKVYENLGQATMLQRFTGFVDGTKIHQAYPSGVDDKTIAWMWKRLLLLLDWTSNLGVLHGAVLPPHVLYYPDNDGGKVRDPRKHSVRLIDWCYSVKSPTTKGKKLKAWVPEWEQFYAPEVLAKEQLGPSTDLYMGAKTMLYLLGGDVQNNIFPAHVPARMAKSFEECLRIDPKRRPQNIGLYFDGFTTLLQQLYGPPKFHEFVMPQ